MHCQLPRWVRRRRPPSVHMIANHHLEEWPIGDIQCKLSYFQHLLLSQWGEKLRSQLPLKAHTVVLYLQKLRHMEHVTLLKNRLSQICRAIRAAAQCHIFVCDTLPSELAIDNQLVQQYKKELFTAVQHINRQLERDFYLSMHVHFWSNNLPIEPWSKYFKCSGELTAPGCFTFRGCMVCKVGITNYSLG